MPIAAYLEIAWHIFKQRGHLTKWQLIVWLRVGWNENARQGSANTWKSSSPPIELSQN